MDDSESQKLKREKKQKHKKKKKDKKDKKKKEEKPESDKEEDEKEKADYENQKDDIIEETFVVLLEMGRGAFGQIHLTYNKRDNVAVATKKVIFLTKFRNLSRIPEFLPNLKWSLTC